MGAALKLVDETPTGRVIREFTLTLASERISARALIERRVREEVKRFNAAQAEAASPVFNGLVQPAEAEQALNGYRLRKPRQVQADKQVQLAIEAFEGNGFFMLLNDRQLEGLDDEIVVTPDTRVSFVKLVPLVGG